MTSEIRASSANAHVLRVYCGSSIAFRGVWREKDMVVRISHLVEAKGSDGASAEQSSALQCGFRAS